MSASVLRACEATTFDGSMLMAKPVQCGAPGQWWTAPSGKAFVLCAHHVEVFAVVREMLAAEAAQPPDPDERPTSVNGLAEVRSALGGGA